MVVIESVIAPVIRKSTTTITGVPFCRTKNTTFNLLKHGFVHNLQGTFILLVVDIEIVLFGQDTLTFFNVEIDF